jgi:hypothetical protein
MKNLKVLYRLPIIVLLLLLPIVASAQDPIVGTWTMWLSPTGRPTTVIAVMTFNSGGTTVEFDTSGTNSSASPGESISLGAWNSTGGRSYTFREENVIYDSSGNLSALAISMCDLSLTPRNTTFSGTLLVNFYSCSLVRCPGPLIAGPTVFQVNAQRF